MTVPTLLDRDRPYNVLVGEGLKCKYVQDGYGFDKDGYFCYDPAKDPSVPKPAGKQEYVCNLPKRYLDKKLDRSKPFGKVLSEGKLPFIFLQNHMGFDRDGNAVWGEPGHWGVPKEGEAYHIETMPETPPAPEPEPEPDMIPIDPDERVYPMDELRNMKLADLKAVFFREFPDQGWKAGGKGINAKMRAIKMLGELTVDKGPEDDFFGTGSTAS